MYHFPERDKSTETDQGTNKESGERNDSIWAVVAGTMKGFPNLSMHQILYEVSYANLILLSSTIPGYKSKTDKKGEEKKSTERKFDESKDANNPANFKGKTERIITR